MSKTFKIVLFIIFLFLYYAVVPSIIAAQWKRYPFLGNPIFYGSCLLLPFILLGVFKLLNKKR